MNPAETGTLTERAAPQNVLIFRALPGLGDLLCSVPALRALRAALPQARIELLGLPAARAFVRRYEHLLDGWVEFPGYPGLPERTPDLSALSRLFEWSRGRFDLSVQMHGSGLLTNPLVALLGARSSAGFYLPGQYCPDPRTYLPYPDHLPEPLRWLTLAQHLGCPAQGEHLEFPLHPHDRQQAARLLAELGLGAGGYALLHPGAQDPRRRWPTGHFARVADALASRGLRVLVTGTADEAERTRAVQEQARAPVVDLAGRTDLGTLAALLEQARLLVSNDTGVSHLAAALGTPSVVVFVASDPARWAPLDRERHRVVGRGLPPESSACAGHCLRDGCAHRAVRAAVPPVHEVLEAVTSQLDRWSPETWPPLREAAEQPP
ncbi:ADP-heptose:LPS heptosyltransferase [Deinobacterium chartae]|uniref:ADP-heptose:LPS heptosyltransferase n=1 Tax=Deinobacterium chartae TaxID=521158 RepID=A0A841HYV0_9DEIO|nr:glycosyltransferase family 9 protein [Deinobacterium chartae]MBB6097399.1 ADP-heptose:LPS heptosyltransferase [Deinobacterium chartae]